MTNFLDHYTLKYTPLSPVHIGTGDSYEPTNYVIDEGTLYEFDTGGALVALNDSDKNELVKVVNGKPNTDMLKAVQKFFYIRREALKPWAINTIPVLDGVARLYASRVGQTANREGDGSQIINKLEIDRTAYNPITRQPILYGSSIKGAIRTALLSHENKKEPLSARDKEQFLVENLNAYERKQRERAQKKIYPRLNEKLFGFSAGKFELDPMRFVQIGDASWSTQDNLPAAQVLITVNRKKELKRDKHGNELLSSAEKNENLCKLLECIPAWRYQAFTGQLNLQLINCIHQSNKQPNANLRFTMEQIAKRCSNFYIPILNAERVAMRDRGFLDQTWDKNIQLLLGKMKEKIINGQAFLIRVGRHSGAESITLNGVRYIKIMKGTPEYQAQTKTLWLAANYPKQRKDLIPFGWLLVEINPINSPEINGAELEKLCNNQHTQAQEWANKQIKEKENLAEKRKESEQRYIREENDRRQQAEHSQRQEQEKKQAEQQKAEQIRLQQEADRQRRASMTEQQLQIETLKQQLQQKQNANIREQIGGPLYSALRELINQTSAWSDDDKAELLGVAKQILEFISASSNKKAKELLKNLQ
ncbi:MAG: RAMP superfamily CRISPR-associated protein [Methylococcaceae bacterium]